MPQTVGNRLDLELQSLLELLELQCHLGIRQEARAMHMVHDIVQFQFEPPTYPITSDNCHNGIAP